MNFPSNSLVILASLTNCLFICTVCSSKLKSSNCKAKISPFLKPQNKPNKISKYQLSLEAKSKNVFNSDLLKIMTVSFFLLYGFVPNYRING